MLDGGDEDTMTLLKIFNCLLDENLRRRELLLTFKLIFFFQFFTLLCNN
jgi:hypothetical protein